MRPKRPIRGQIAGVRRLAPRKPPDIGSFGDGWRGEDLPTTDAQGRPYPPIRITDLPVDIILPRLKQVGGAPPTWSARCPAHADLNPSLSVAETSDGLVLIHCFAGCESEAVMEAIGLNMAFLFPSPYALRSRGQKPRRRTVRGTPDPSIPVPEPDIHYAHFETLMRGYSTGSVVLRPLARQLGLPPRSLVALGVGYDERRQRWVFPERDWRGRLVGLVYRDFAGHRWCEDGSTRGLTIPADLDQTSGPIYLVEGASDTAGMHSVGAAATGRPTACASLLAKQWLTKFLQREPHRDVLVVGDRDPEREGRRTGEAGAVALAGHLETTLGRRVRWALPAPMFKDVRDQIVAGQWEQGLYWERES